MGRLDRLGRMVWMDRAFSNTNTQYRWEIKKTRPVSLKEITEPANSCQIDKDPIKLKYIELRIIWVRK